MLTKKDKEEIRQIFKEELREALFRTVTIERGPRGPGDPEKVIKEEQWHVLDFLAAYMPKIEAALRGMQKDVDQAKNKVLSIKQFIDVVTTSAIGKITDAQSPRISPDSRDTPRLDR